MSRKLLFSRGQGLNISAVSHCRLGYHEIRRFTQFTHTHTLTQLPPPPSTAHAQCPLVDDWPGPVRSPRIKSAEKGMWSRNALAALATRGVGPQGRAAGRGGGGEESDFGIDWGFSRRPLTGEGLSSQIISETKRRSQTGYVGVRKLLSRRI